MRFSLFAAVIGMMLSSSAAAVAQDSDGSSGKNPPAKEAATPTLTGVAKLRAEAEAMKPLVRSDVAKRFLEATDTLPAIAPRTLYRDPQTRTLYSKSAADKLDEEKRKALAPVQATETLYYNTKYGSPLAYARPLEVLGQAGLKDVSGLRILDFGYGTVGHLRLLASLGANVVGVDVDPFLLTLYSERGDQGTVQGRSGGKDGNVTLVEGQFPAKEETNKAVGDGYDLIISKNTLKNGYLHPEQPVDKRMLVDLGVDDATFVKTLYRILKPGGRVLIYNLSPAPSKPGEPYKPWADGRSPFPKSLYESAGFKVIAFDVNDDAAARAMARALGWDKGPSPMDVEKDLFAHYTLVQKP